MTTATEITATAPYAYENEDGLQISATDTCWFCDRWQPTLRGDGGHLGVPGLTCDPCNDYRTPHAYTSQDGLRIESSDTCAGCGQWRPDFLGFEGDILMCPPCGGISVDDPMTAQQIRTNRLLVEAGYSRGF